MANAKDSVDYLLDSIANTISTKSGISGTKNLAAIDVAAKAIVTPSGSVSITSNGTHNVAQYASAVVSVSGGGGGGDRPSYLIPDYPSTGDTVSKLYFNTNYAKNTMKFVLGEMETYTSDVLIAGYDTCEVGIGDLYAVDLTDGDYALVYAVFANDVVASYTLIFTSKSGVLGATAAGWQTAIYNIGSNIQVTLTNVEEYFATVMDRIVAAEAISFGKMEVEKSVTSNGTYTAPNGQLYKKVTVNVPIASTEASNGAISYAYDSSTNTLTITQDPPLNA